MFSSTQCNLTATRVLFTRNQALMNGGALAVDSGGIAKVHFSTFLENLAYHSGGAICVSEYSYATIANSTFGNNSAKVRPISLPPPPKKDDPL